MNQFNELGLQLPSILIPKKGIDLEKWAVVACDQFTSEKKYWEEAVEFIGKEPSTMNLIFPECYLEDPNPEERIKNINQSMNAYVKDGIFQEYKDSFFLVKRTCVGKKPRYGLIVALDLDRYSWEKGSKSLIRATEGTILSRIPPRKAIRKDAPLELPHILVLISDAKRQIIEALKDKSDKLEKAYCTPLMKNGGQLEAWVVNKDEDLKLVLDGFKDLYASLDPENQLLFAMGDGNHSFATAKSCWEDIKPTLSEEERKNHPARFCMVELENIFDEGLEFEPIHRVMFNTTVDAVIAELAKHCESYSIEKVGCRNCIHKEINKGDKQRLGLCDSKGHYVVTLENPSSNIAPGTFQSVIDEMIKTEAKVDYIHGLDVTDKLGQQEGNVGVFMPEVSKETFFDTIIKDGALPRKTFSMGEAQEKRYYMEARKIK